MNVGELRSVLAQQPGLVTWQRLCVLLDEAYASGRAELEEKWIPYILHHIEFWPDALRVASPTWLISLVLGHDVPMLQLARTVHLGDHDEVALLLSHLGQRQADYPITRLTLNGLNLLNLSQGFFDNTAFQHLEYLGLSSVWSASGQMAVWLEQMPKLTTLSMDMMSTSGILGAEMYTVIPDTVVALDLGDGSIQDSVLWLLSEAPIWHRLVRLSVRRAALDEDALLPLFTATSLQHLDAGFTRVFPTPQHIEAFLSDVPSIEKIHLGHLEKPWTVQGVELTNVDLVL